MTQSGALAAGPLPREEPLGVTEAGGTFRPLRLYRTSRRRSGGQAISTGRRRVSGTQEGRRLRGLRSRGPEDR
jgi:hypothetical protein